MNDGPATKKRARVSKACDECNKRKTKCTGGNPCNRCTEHNITCIFSIPVNKRGPSSGYVKCLVDTIETLKARLGDNSSVTHGAGASSDMNLSVNSTIEVISPTSSMLSNSGNIIPNFKSSDLVSSAADGGQMLMGDWGTAINGTSSLIQSQSNHVWNHDTFLFATLVGSDGPVPWWDIYYRFVHPKMSVIFKSWFLSHYKDLPLILLHAMYCVSIFPLSGPAEEGEFHFTACKSVTDEAIENPDPLKTAAIMLMAVYSMNSKRVKSAVSYLCLSIRFCQILGIDKGKYDVWKCNLGLIPGFEKESPKDFCRSLWCCLYANDFYAIFLIGVPGSVTLDIDTSYLQEYRSLTFQDGKDDIKSFLCFCSYYIPLIVIGRKALRLNGTGDNVVLSRNMLLNRLADWYQSVAIFDTSENEQSYLTMYSMPFLYLIYNFIRLLLLKSTFLKEISSREADHSNQVIEQVIKSADAISTTIRMYLKYNPNLLNLTMLMKYCVLFAGAFHCAHIGLLPTPDGITKKITILSDHVKFLEIFGLVYPQCLLDAKTLIEWTSAPQAAVSFLRTP